MTLRDTSIQCPSHIDSYVHPLAKGDTIGIFNFLMKQDLRKFDHLAKHMARNERYSVH
jgi:hypothetical protein